jgi:ADP-ribose pyrophosphatase YjhB (NUDIX family)
MSRTHLFADLKRYQQFWIDTAPAYPSRDAAEESRIWSAFYQFAEERPDGFERHCEPGHITGSALVLDPEGRQVLLMHHRKLDKWLQLGGHADGDTRVDRVANKEAQEESGLSRLEWIRYDLPDQLPGQVDRPLPFDLDIHWIPARKGEPAHRHYDVRYLLRLAQPEPIRRNAEAKELRWVPLHEASQWTEERSMQRQFQKVAYLQEQGLCPAGAGPIDNR